MLSAIRYPQCPGSRQEGAHQVLKGGFPQDSAVDHGQGLAHSEEDDHRGNDPCHLNPPLCGSDMECRAGIAANLLSPDFMFSL